MSPLPLFVLTLICVTYTLICTYYIQVNEIYFYAVKAGAEKTDQEVALAEKLFADWLSLVKADLKL
jgi:hypothetical protein